MKNVFPPHITALPEADLPIEGATAYMLQSEEGQALFMMFGLDAEIPEHSHRSQWSVVIDGKIEISCGGKKRTYTKGDNYFIKEGEPHSARIYAGYADITYFDQKDRYKTKTDSC